MIGSEPRRPGALRVVFSVVAVLLAMATALPGQLVDPRTDPVIVLRQHRSPVVRLAAREIRRYVYLRTGELLRIVAVASEQQDSISLDLDPTLGSEEHALRTSRSGDRRRLSITGGSDLAILYGAYVLAERLGVRFHLHGDSIPDERIPFRVPDLDEVHTPLFETRGIQPFHDFPEGPDWWTLDDYRACFAQMAKMRLNLFGLHCYPEGGVGPEPLVWIGLPDDVGEDGTVRSSYPSRWASTSGGSWGYGPARTAEFAAGASLVFAGDDHGSPVTDGFRPLPSTPDECNAVFDRAGRFLDEAFSFGRRLGVRACIGTETPLHIPTAVVAHLRAQGLDPDDPATLRALYRGMFMRIARTHPLDFYWLWTPESWTWGGNDPAQLDKTLADIAAAAGALEDLGHPFTLATSGWVLGPQQDRTALDRHLPAGSPVSCINRQVGFSFVEPAFARIDGRPKWAIPWLEDDPNMVGAQLWVGRTRRDAADAHAFGCTGLLGIHWRTRVLAPNFAALAQAGWSQEPWNPQFGEPVEFDARRVDVRHGGSVANYAQNAIADTDLDPVYRTCRWGLNGYRIQVPDGVLDLTLQLCEVHYDAAGKRVFGVRLQGRPVVEHLDVFARVGKDKALDLRFGGVEVEEGELAIDFAAEVEFPFVAGIVIEGADGFRRKINCGGGAWQDYEADLPEAGDVHPLGDRPRDLACDDFYVDWARAEFGLGLAEPLAALFTRLDGGEGDYSGDKSRTSIPRPSEWLGGPGGIRPNPAPWSGERERYGFVDRMALLGPGLEVPDPNHPGCSDRFDYWLETFRFHRALGELGCTRGELDRIVARLEAEPDAAVRARLARQDALPVRLALARQWEGMMTHLLQAFSTQGELGTIANLEQHTLRNARHPRFLDLHDAKLAEWLGAPLPAEAWPGGGYRGRARIVVPTVRSAVAEGEALTLSVIVLDDELPSEAVLYWRQLGEKSWLPLELTHVARAVHEVTLPPAGGDVLEYYIRARIADGRTLHWPATAPRRAQTMVVVPAQD